ncbi:exopolysaccharide biosynthesis polyprenyl glycosylphosphotransferase [Empedobacter brevis]|uniref:exopolysaccharide biosynthesis polyprenyl glycosylphosphotransferase n=1 Tax=Empedobacter brevis TaxID=247 RepID=UPI0039AE9DBE
MKESSGNKFYFIQEIIDLIIISILFFVFQKLQYLYFFPKDQVILDDLPTYKELFISHYKALLLIIISWIIVSDHNKLHQITFTKRIVNNIKRLFLQIIVISIVIFAISGLKQYDLFSWQLGLAYISSIFIVLFILRLFYLLFNILLNKRGVGVSNILVLDENLNTNKFIDLFNTRNRLGVRFIDHISDMHDLKVENGFLLYKDIFFDKYLIDNQIDQVFLSQMGKFSNDVLVKIYELCEINHIQIIYIPYSIYNELTELKVQYIDTLPILVVKRFPLDLTKNKLLKFIFDKIFSLLVIIFILSWLIPLISIIIMIDSKGPIFFIQKRNGLNGKVFNCYKFRTMRNTKMNSVKATVRNDERVTRVGKFLRKTSLDEIPQFINVFLGDMSVVGPRPHMITQDYFYRDIIKKYNLRHYVKPGITGLSQVRGYRGAIDCNEDMENRIRTDIFYIRNWSIFLDFHIIYLTIMLVIKGDENAI